MQKFVAQVRPLVAADLEAVVALDAEIGQQFRRGYFERRLAAALSFPKRHLQVAVADANQRLLGFLLARQAGGEFGRHQGAVALETIGVRPCEQRAGLGPLLLDSLEGLSRARGLSHIVMQIDWRNLPMLAFAKKAQFALDQRLVLGRPVVRTSLPEAEELFGDTPLGCWAASEDENDQPGQPKGQVRVLRRGDFDKIVQLDAAHTGFARPDYFAAKFDEVLSESAIAMSLVAEYDGRVVAFAMARVDFGAFGRLEPTAQLDTIGVAKTHVGQGVGRAVLSQLLTNLSALHIERIDTEVYADQFGLLRFLHRMGFKLSQTLALQKKL